MGKELQGWGIRSTVIGVRPYKYCNPRTGIKASQIGTASMVSHTSYPTPRDAGSTDGLNGVWYASRTWEIRCDPPLRAYLARGCPRNPLHGVLRSQETTPPSTVGLYLWSCGGPRGAEVPHRRGTPAPYALKPQMRGAMTTSRPSSSTSATRNDLNSLHGLDLQAKTRIWPRLSYERQLPPLGPP
jgi:hypothetical protein